MKRALAIVLAATAWVALAAARADDRPRPRPPAKAAQLAPLAGHSPDAGVPADAGIEGDGRPVRVHLSDGSSVTGTVRAEEREALVIDCSLGVLSIPRARISTIAYDAAAAIGQKRAPVQMLDDDGPPPPRRTTNP